MTAVQLRTAEEAITAVRPGDRVYVEGGAPHPHLLADALVARAIPVEIVTSVMGPPPAYCIPGSDAIRVKSFRGSPQTREAFQRGLLDVVPTGLSAIPSLLAGPLRPDVALIQVSPPDRHGICSLGASVLYHRCAIAAARVVIAEINPAMPRTVGDGDLHVSQISAFVATDQPLVEFPSGEPTERERAMARHVAAYIGDGATVQIGMGSFADAVVDELRDRRNLRVHAGLLSDGVLGLIEAGVVADRPGAITTGAVAGTRRVYDLVDGNPTVALRGVEHTHSPEVLAKLPALVAVNSAIEVDLTGQVNGDTLRGLPVSGAGGALDFAHAAACSADGVSIIALTTTARSGGHRRLVAQLDGNVSIPRSEVDVVITEHGAIDLRGLGLRERVAAVAAISGTATREPNGAQP